MSVVLKEYSSCLHLCDTVQMGIYDGINSHILIQPLFAFWNETKRWYKLMQVYSNKDIQGCKYALVRDPLKKVVNFLALGKGSKTPVTEKFR